MFQAAAQNPSFSFSMPSGVTTPPPVQSAPVPVTMPAPVQVPTQMQAQMQSQTVNITVPTALPLINGATDVNLPKVDLKNTTTVHKVQLANFEGARLTSVEPENHAIKNPQQQNLQPGAIPTIPGANPQQVPQKSGQTTASAPTYWAIGLRYAYPTPTQADPNTYVTDQLLVEFPEVEFPFGVGAFPKQSGPGMDYSLWLPIDNSKPNIPMIDAKIREMYKASALILEKHRDKVGLGGGEDERFEAATAGKSGYSCPIRPQVDKTTKMKLLDKPYQMSLKLIHRGENGSWKTNFYGANGDIIPWDFLTNSNLKIKFKGIILVHVKQIFVGQVKSLQMEVRSVVVTAIEKREAVSGQIDTISNLSKNSDLANSVSEQLAKLMSEASKAKPQEKETKTDTTAASVSITNLVPTGREIMATIQQNNPAEISASSAPALPTMQDFTTAAPIRPTFNLS